MKTILYLTDLYYVAKGRKYYEADLLITSKLKEHFNVLIGHPQQSLAFLISDAIVVYRNLGCVLHFEDYYREFLKTVEEKNIISFISFDGKGDQQGKQCLLDLQEEGYAVIPTAVDIAEIEKLGNPQKYIVKLMNEADSAGMGILCGEDLLAANPKGELRQPLLDLQSEVHS